MWRITYRGEDGLKEVYIQAPSINIAIDKYEEQFSEPVIAIDHKPDTDFIS